MTGVTHVHLWQSKTFSDVWVVLKLSSERDSADGTPLKVIRRLPGHRALLSASPVLQAQLERWQQEPSPPCKRLKLSLDGQAPAQQQPQDQQSDQQQPEATLILDSEEQEPAAMAVLGFLYGVNTTPEQLTDLQHLHMVTVADMLQVSAAAEAAVNNLVSIAVAPAKGLSDSTKQRLCSMESWPPCLVAALPSLTQQLPLLDAAVIWARAAAPSSPSSLEAEQAAPHSSYMQDRLLQKLGDLEKVWKNVEKQKQLLGLPLAAMQLLLASSKLKVGSEDTVLFTAQVYADQLGEQLQGQPPCEARQLAKQQLAQLIRCPYLPPVWLIAAVQATEDQLLLAPMKDQLLELLAFLQVWPDFNTAAAQKFTQLVPGTPSSWQLGQRRLCAPATSVTLRWRLPVSHIEACCREAAARKERVMDLSRGVSAPLHGTGFMLGLSSRYTSEGVTVGFFVLPKLAVPRMFMRHSARIQAAAVSRDGSADVLLKIGHGWPDFFELGPMRDGWDEVAWASKQLPTEGDLTIEATVDEVPMGGY